MFGRWLIPDLALLLLAAGCGPSTDSNPPAAPSPPTNLQVFQVKGVVQEVQLAEKKVVIKHEAVPGYMNAMTMPFDVKDTNELAGLGAGDPVTFRMFVNDTDGWVDRIRVTGPKVNTPPTTGSFRLVRDVEPLNLGDPLPEYHFTNQFGRPFGTAQFKGQALAINFLFTRCPYPLFCPLTARNFTTTQEKLLALANGPTNWQLLTISFDPEFDTPAVLRTFADRYQCNPERWTFATGPLIDITAIGDQFGLLVLRDANGGFDHNLRTVVIDAAGRVQRVMVGNEWKPEELVEEMVKAAGVK